MTDATGPLAPNAVCASTLLPSDGSTSGNGRAPSARNRGNRAVYLITAGELAASGLPSGVSPSALGWRYSTGPGVTATGTLTIYLENTTDTVNAKGTSFAAAIVGMTTVHDASTVLPNTTAGFDIPFSGGSPFTYTGGGLYVAFDWRYPVGTLSNTAIVACNTALTAGLASSVTSGATPPPSSDTLAASNFRPETRLTLSIANDVSVDYVLTMGQLPNGLVSPHVVRAIVTNRGDAQTDVPVTLNITGAETFADTTIVPALAACGGRATVSFAPFTPSVLGDHTVTVSVPADDIPGNNSMSRNLENTVNRSSYKHAGTVASGGFGATGSTAEFAAKFSTTVPTQIDAVIVEFQSTVPAAAYKLSIREDDGSGMPGPQIYVDAASRSVVAGSATIRLPEPVSAGPGDFYVGVQQTTATNLGLSFDAETPIRIGAFYLAVGANPFSDFSPQNNFKLNLGIIIGSCLAPMTNDVQPASATVCAGNPLTFDSSVSGGTGARTYQWTENGNDLPGETASSLSVTMGSAGAFAYNAEVTDDGGCIGVLDPSSSIGTWVGGGGACDDGDPCTGPDVCAGPACAGPDLCDDSDACTSDQCDGQGVCTHAPVSCDDGNPCTNDACDPLNGCSFANNTAPCSDLNPCTAGDACSEGICQAGSPKVCDDADTCTADTCESSSGECVFTDIRWSCDDGTICTEDSCDSVTGCVHAPVPGSCDDGNACTAGDACSGGVCQPGIPAVCVDGNACTTDGCNPSTGACVFTNNASACDDGDPCTVGDACGGGTCQPGAPIIPAETANVRATSKTTFTWSATMLATQYDAMRGSVALLPVGPGFGDETCFPDLGAASFTDGKVPGAGQAFWYVVRGENACFSGDYGTQSDGTPRVTATCP
jgi:hypothetical protein